MKKFIAFLGLALFILMNCAAPKNASDSLALESDYFEKASGYTVEDFFDVGDTTEGLAFNGQDLYVGTYHDGVIYKISIKDGNIVKSVFISGFTALAGIAFDKNGDLWAIEYSGKVNQISPQGVLKKVYTEYKYYFMNKKLAAPNAIAIHSNGTVYVTDGGNIVAIKDGVASYFTYVTTGYTSIVNGMALSADETTLYALECSNSTFFKASIFKIKLDANGKYVSKSKLTPSKAMTYMDGIALDINGLIYITAELKTIATVNPSSGLVTILNPTQPLNTPANFAFGYGSGFDPKSIYLTQLGNINDLKLRDGYTMLKKMTIGVDGLRIPAMPAAQN